MNIPKYRLGPVIYTGVKSLDSFNLLAAGNQIIAKWTALPVFDFRLTKSLQQKVYFLELNF